MLTVGSLFSGIGGIDLGLERAGMRTRWFVEIDPHCRNVLARHWPGLPVYGDITAIDWAGVERVDVLAGGFPCQPVSNAGKRLGTDDERWLWPEFARAIRGLRPRYVLVENVAALLGRGFGEVVTDLAALGYDAEWDCIPAAAVGAPHLRDRLWLVAYPRSPRRRKDARGTSGHEGADEGRPALHGDELGRDGARRTVADANGDAGRQGRASDTAQGTRGRDADRGGVGASVADAERIGPPRQGQPLQPVYPATRPYRQATEPLDGRLAEQWATEPDVGRVADGVPHRVDRLRALGNAVVPQVVEWIGWRIVAREGAMNTTPETTRHSTEWPVVSGAASNEARLPRRGAG